MPIENFSTWAHSNAKVLAIWYYDTLKFQKFSDFKKKQRGFVSLASSPIPSCQSQTLGCMCAKW
jgi:hypothetical protein